MIQNLRATLNGTQKRTLSPQSEIYETVRLQESATYQFGSQRPPGLGRGEHKECHHCSFQKGSSKNCLFEQRNCHSLEERYYTPLQKSRHSCAIGCMASARQNNGKQWKETGMLLTTQLHLVPHLKDTLRKMK